MKPAVPNEKISSLKMAHRVYVALFLAMAFTGFGQMPIFKRYYLADVPGMAWTADFYLTHTFHYVGAILLLGLVAYLAFDHVLAGKKRFRLTATARVRIVLLTAIIVTGIFRVLKNLPDVVFSPDFTLFVDISHLAFMMGYGIVAFFCLFARSPWLLPRQA